MGKKNRGNLGKKFSEEHKKKISLAHIGKKLSDKSKEKISKANTGRRYSKEINKKKVFLWKKISFGRGG